MPWRHLFGRLSDAEGSTENTVIEPGVYRRLLLMVALGAGVSLWLILTYLLPFRPLAINAYTADPVTGCPGVVPDIESNRTLRVPPYARLTGGVLVTYWQDQAGAVTLPDSYILDVTTLRSGVGPSPVLRYPPTEPGVWTLHTTITLTGRVLGTKREATVTHVQPDLYRVLPATDVSCR